MDPPNYSLRPTPDGRFMVKFRMRCGCTTTPMVLKSAEQAEPLAEDVKVQVCQFHLAAFAIDTSNNLMLMLRDQFVGPPAPRHST